MCSQVIHCLVMCSRTEAVAADVVEAEVIHLCSRTEAAAAAVVEAKEIHCFVLSGGAEAAAAAVVEQKSSIRAAERGLRQRL